MEIQVIKLELIEMLLKTEEITLLKKIKRFLLEEQVKNNHGKVDYDLIDKRRQAQLNEDSASYTWEEVKEKVRAVKL